MHSILFTSKNSCPLLVNITSNKSIYISNDINLNPSSTKFVIRYIEKRKVTTENNQQLKKK